MKWKRRRKGTTRRWNEKEEENEQNENEENEKSEEKSEENEWQEREEIGINECVYEKGKQ